MPKKHRSLALAIFCLLGLFVSSVCRAGESEQAQPYEKVRYPTFANGRLQSLLEATKADVFDLPAGTPRIKLEDVVITLYDLSNVDTLPEDEAPPVKMIITSDEGFFTCRPPEPGAQMEEIANLQKNVVMKQMRIDPPQGESQSANLRPLNRPDGSRATQMEPGVETIIRCQHAQWNNTLRKLNGDGDVEMEQEGSKINGTGFLYLADDDAMDAGGGASNIKDWGGIVFIEHNACMEIDRGGAFSMSGDPLPDGDKRSEKTIITCEDTASYKLREKEIQFEKNVEIIRSDMTITSDILKVFLRHEDDPLPETQCDQAQTPLPGQVKNIVATIGRRSWSVVVTGYRTNPVTGEREPQYVAKGGRADFDYDNNRINLTDSREQMFPEVVFGRDGNDRITDRNLTFVFHTPCPGEEVEDAAAETVLDSLNTFGGRGEVELRTRPDDPASGPSIVTRVNYRGEMSYSRQDGRIRFLDRVTLKREDLAISSELLDIRLNNTDSGMELNQVRRILAEDNVEIQSGDYNAKSERAEYDVYTGVAGPPGSGLDTLRLFGPPQATWIRDSKGNQITAPEIHMQRLTVGSGQKDQHLMVARGGVSVCDFVTEPATATEKAKVVSISCVNGMEYNQVNKKARFEGQVTAASDAPEDNYVLNSDRLLVDFEESPDPDKPGEYLTWIRRITAEGNARLMQDTRLCEAANIIRDFPSSDSRAGDIYLQGVPAQGDRRARPAAYREQNGDKLGSQFVAPLIKSSSKGDLIQANGPGELSMPDEDSTSPTDRAIIQFAGAASYESFGEGQPSEAKFWGGVKMTQPSRKVEIVSEELDARFANDGGQGGSFTGTASNVDIEHIGRLRRVEGRNNVKIVSATSDGGFQTAVGDVGVVEFTGSGNVVRLTADRSTDRRRYVMARNSKGMTIRSPEIEVREAQGITRASGPGDLQIPPDEAGDGMAKVPTRVLYGENGSMVYNELSLGIRVTNNVRVVQPGPGGNWSYPSLDGICDRLDIMLGEPPGESMTGTDALSRVTRMDAIGSVLLRVYAEPPPENPNMEWYLRPGTTLFTRGDQAVYDVPKGEISIFCLDNHRQPQLLLNIVEGSGSPRRQRMKADRFVLKTTPPRSWNFQGQLDSSAIRDGEPFDFVGD